MRGHYRVGADAPAKPVSWGKWIGIGAAIAGSYVFIARPVMRRGTPPKKDLPRSGQSAYWDTFSAKHRE